MDFQLNEEQIMIQRMVREFAQNEVKPLSKELDAKKDPAECFSPELMKKASELGLRTLSIPKEYGGSGVDKLTETIVAEELGAGDLGFAGMVGHQASMGRFMVRFLNEEQRKEFLSRFMEDDTFYVSSGMTEPDHGTDNQLPYDAPGVGLATVAQKKGDGYVINGVKQFISQGPIAKLCLLFARTGGLDLGIKRNTSLFLVPLDTTGCSVGKVHDKMGRRLLINGELIFTDAYIPARYLVGKENQGWAARRPMALATINTSAALLGCMRTCYEESLNYAKDRIQGGRPIVEHPVISAKLGEMRILIESCRLLLWRGAWDADIHKQEYDEGLLYLMKAYVDKAALTVAIEMVDIFGGMGTEKSLPIEKYVRDVFTALHGFMTRDINLYKGMKTLLS